MAEGKREYIAIFSIGAKLLGSFKGALSAAKSRLADLAKTAKTFGAVAKGIGIAFAGLAAGILGTAVGMLAKGIWSIYKKIFDDAAANAEKAADIHRTLLTYLRTDAGLRKKGNAFIENQIGLLGKHNEKLAEQSGLSQDIYDQANQTLVTYGAMPHHLAEMAGPLGDMLAATKGPRANMADMEGLTHQVGNAIVGGPIRQLVRMGVLQEGLTKGWSKMTKEQRFQKILKGLKQFEGAAKRAMDTPVGKMVKFHNSMDKLSSTLGEILLPAMGDVADMWRKFIEMPSTQRFLISATQKWAEVLKSVAGYISNDIIPALNKMAEDPAFRQMASAATQFVKVLVDGLKTIPDELSKMWESTLVELEAILIVMAAVSDKFKPALESVSRMKEELRLKKMLGAKPDMAPPLLAGYAPPVEKPMVSESLTAFLPKDLAAMEAANHKINEFQMGLKPAVDARSGWEKFGETVGTVTNAIGDKTEQRLKIPYESFKATLAGVKGDWKGMGEHAGYAQDAAKTALADTGDMITTAITTPLQLAKQAWDALAGSMAAGVSVPTVAAGALPNPAPKELDTANMPHYASGGIVNKPTIAMIGEEGPEAVVPLNQITKDLFGTGGGFTRELQDFTDAVKGFVGAISTGATFMGKALKTSFGGGGGGFGGGGGGGGWSGAASAASAYAPPAGLPDTNLVMQRASKMAELRDANTAEHLYSLVHQEVGSQGQVAQQAFMETVFNRAASRNKSLMSTITDRAYFPAVSLRKAAVSGPEAEGYKGMLDTIAAGSNVSNYATGNASGGVGFAGGPQTFATHGERFGTEGADLKWAKAMKSMPTPAANPTNMNFKPNITINGNATPEDQEAMDKKLRDLSKDFIQQFKDAQYQERRLSYESGYA